MNSVCDAIVDEIMQYGQAKERVSYSWLIQYLEQSTNAPEIEFLRNLQDHPARHIAILKQPSPAWKVVVSFALDILDKGGFNYAQNDVFMAYNRSAMFFILLQEYAAANTPEGVLSIISDIHKSALARFFDLATNQADALCALIEKIVSYLKSEATGRRIVLIELPVGNSLIMKMIETFLSPYNTVSRVCISLSRNDKAMLGIKRFRLLKDKIEKFGLMEGDIVLYVDEWNSGANFNAICRFLKKLIPANVAFFPAAVLSNASHADDRYSSYCLNHDRLHAENRLSGEEWRCLLPPLPTDLGLGRYFFWAESDRMAGYRKLQIHGSIYSSLVQVIEWLHADREMLLRTLKAASPEIGLILANNQSSEVHLLDLFEESYVDFLECKEALRTCAENEAQGGGNLDMESELKKDLEIYDKIIGNRKAKRAVALAGTYINYFGSLDPIDRYYFRHHAPVLVPLSGVEGIHHQSAMEFLNSRFKLISAQ